jgi:hypothetical protein
VLTIFAFVSLLLVAIWWKSILASNTEPFPIRTERYVSDREGASREQTDIVVAVPHIEEIDGAVLRGRGEGIS